MMKPDVRIAKRNDGKLDVARDTVPVIWAKRPFARLPMPQSGRESA
jgi:hypothetical protein